MTNVTQARRMGRPRSETTRLAILASAFELLSEVGFRAVTMEEIAKRANASKATLYRWWPSKSAVFLEAVNNRHEKYPPMVDTGDCRADLISNIAGVIQFYATVTGGAVLDLIADSRFDPTLAKALEEQFFASRREIIVDVLQNGIERGQVDESIDVGVVINALWGGIYYHKLVTHTPVDKRYAVDLVNLFWPVIAKK